ncbi:MULTISPECIES: FAD-dependent monooxygenase [unclassified Ruegeria]|uniref:FAD-dependent monooxygenase n=1 Tax=unclassified Ruegeria TaxID=2625375 RepID=UPI0014895DC3|nr:MULTISPECIES: FAD-dependent monooxygenase [unclassified Ruegeria]
MGVNGLKFCVIGGGIGGLAAALALRQQGGDITVLEQAPALTEVGAGLQISANGMAVLRALRVASETPEAGQRSFGTELRDYRHGRLVSRIPSPKAGPTYYYHRADLLDLLHAGAVQAGVDIRLDACVETVLTTPDGALVQLENGTQLEADCIIAADGGRSRIRPILNGPEEPRFTRQTAWRATMPWKGRDDTPRAVLTMGPGRHVVTYPLRDQNLMNIVAVEERSDWRAEGWRQEGDPKDLRARFADFGGTVSEILDRVEQANLWALFLRPVAQQWQNGRLALLGDAAHPTLPFMAQGACLALEDAWCLARTFQNQPDIARALSAYETTRKPRATKVVAAAGANARNFHLRGPARFVAQAGLMVLGPQLGRRYDWIYDYDPTA